MNATETLHSVFADSELNSAFNKYGYAVTKLLPENAINELKDFYLNNPNPFQGAFHTTHFTTDKAYKKKVHEKIVEVVAPFARKLFPNYVPAFGNYMVKE